MTNKPRLFGTDGVRGVAGQYPLDPKTVFLLGRAIGNVLNCGGVGRDPKILMGRDTRESGEWISRTLAAGLKLSGAEVTSAGVFTTPGIAFLTRKRGFDAGVVISASHNSYRDNGIKVLAGSGIKLSEAQELEIERVLETFEAPQEPVPQTPLEPAPGLMEEYLARLESLLPNGSPAAKPRLVVDCANGAASRLVPMLMNRLGIEARILHAAPDGRNINHKCGSLYPADLAAATKETGADLGVAFDGDADRAIFATPEGRITDGDHILYVAALHLKGHGELKSNTVVGTLMTNFGLEMALARHGIGLKRTAVGDKYVLEEMLRCGSNLGGEPSGHIIFGDISFAGDGIITLLETLRVIREAGKPFHELLRELRQLPQIIRNVRVREKQPLDAIPEVNRAVEDCRREVGERGRVVVRYSGTEPLARIMVEAEDAETVERHAGRIAQAIGTALGTSH